MFERVCGGTLRLRRVTLRRRFVRADNPLPVGAPEVPGEVEKLCQLRLSVMT
jgi:hypothetical protein